MSPYVFVEQSTARGESLLSLCAGIGYELNGLNTQDITAVDIVPQYLETLKNSYPHVKTVLSDVLKYTHAQPSNSVDVISIIDGIEHLTKIEGLLLMKEMERVARKEILLFTPQGGKKDGFVKNEPHNAWGIEGGDEHQVHQSGWKLSELEELGFDLLYSEESISQHNEPYTALMMIFRK